MSDKGNTEPLQIKNCINHITSEFNEWSNQPKITTPKTEAYPARA